jgi:hypothetical protein
MKFDYLQLFMHRDLALKFAEDKEREIAELLLPTQFGTLFIVDNNIYFIIIGNNDT